MPPLQDLELNLLTQSLLSEGCRDPLVVWNGEVVDGCNRYKICRENNIPFSFVEMEFEDEAAAKKWIIRNQLARRNVPDFVKCEMVLPLEEELKSEAKKRQGTRTDLLNNKDNCPEREKGSQSRDELGKLAGVSGKTIMRVKKLLESADEETKEKLRNGEISINGAYVEMKDKEKQRQQKTRHGDIVPGFGIGEILREWAGQSIDRQPDSVYDIPPVEVFGNVPVDNLEMKASMELIHTKSDLQFSTDNYLRRVGEILRSMSAVSVNDENIQILRGIVTNSYNQIMEMMNTKLNGAQICEAFSTTEEALL